jgi:L-alanine-DL-glutamate epimerase-like enolase superfamily enzyme
MHMKAYTESWPIRGQFTISRGSKTQADVIVVECYDAGRKTGWGEAVPYKHYNETIEGSLALIEASREKIEKGISRFELLDLMPPCAARNAIDCALWDHEAKIKKKPVWQLAGLKEPQNSVTAYTIGFKSVEEMGQDAFQHAHRPLLKLKLATEQDLDRVQAVRKAAPESRIIVDANEAWTIEILENLAPKLSNLGVVLIEQPLPAGKDEALRGRKFAIPLCADESCRRIEDLNDLAQKYDYINIKLDKTGGLTHALDFVQKRKH